MQSEDIHMILSADACTIYLQCNEMPRNWR